MGLIGRVLLLGTALTLAACGDRDPVLLHADANAVTDGPDEFSVIPQHPLVDPPSIASLPAPTPGAANLAELDPLADVAVALGGRASATRRTGRIEATALVAYAARFGSDLAIRRTLAAEDLAFRRDHKPKPLERLFAVNVYFTAYAPMTLDQYAELARLRAAGVLTPAAPPEPVN